jgi:hypothetical protein
LHRTRAAHNTAWSTTTIFLSVTLVCTPLLLTAGPRVASTAAWHIVDGRAMPDPPLDNMIFGVSCPSSRSCVAVGQEGNRSFQATLVQTLSKGMWRVTPSPMAPSPFLVDSLTAVSCPSGGACSAVGSAADVSGTKERTLVETRRNGTWVMAPSPNTTSATNSLSGVSCASATSCVAVGQYGSPNSQGTLVETLSDGTWRRTPSPDAAQPYVVNFLNAVSCSSPAHCVAAGFAATPDAMESRTLIETWAGGTWRVTPSPDTGAAINQLFGLWCTSATSCVAVGNSGSIGAQRALVETLSGGAWKITRSPGTKLGLDVLLSAWCGHSSCVAAGYAMNSAGTEAKTLIESRIDGSWEISPTPNTTSPLNEFNGFSCSTTCYAVGLSGTDNAQKALIESD